MSLAIESIINQYIKLQNLEALEKMREHRQRLLDQCVDTAYFSVDLIRSTYLAELDAIDTGIAAFLGKPRGNLDNYSETRISGWAQYSQRPDKRVPVNIYINDERVGDVIADRFRDDLLKAGIGDGHHAFQFALPEGIYRPPLRLELRVGSQILKQVTID